MTEADHPLADLYSRAPPAVGGDYTSPSSRAQLARWFIGFTVGAEALSLVALGSQRALLNRGVGEVTLGEWNRSNDRVDGAELLGVALLVVAAIFFLRWLHLSYRNQRALNIGMRFTPGWAVGWWFIPFLNLWRSRQVVDELWRKTGDGDAAPSGSPLILIWWIAFLGSNFLERIAAVTGSGTFDELKRRNLLFGLSHAAALAAGICLFVLVGRLSARQEETAERLMSVR